MQIKKKYLFVNQAIINMNYFKLKLANFIINKKKTRQMLPHLTSLFNKIIFTFF
jgi:hypothetical protein